MSQVLDKQERPHRALRAAMESAVYGFCRDLEVRQHHCREREKYTPLFRVVSRGDECSEPPPEFREVPPSVTVRCRGCLDTSKPMTLVGIITRSTMLRFPSHKNRQAHITHCRILICVATVPPSLYKLIMRWTHFSSRNFSDPARMLQSFQRGNLRWFKFTTSVF